MRSISALALSAVLSIVSGSVRADTRASPGLTAIHPMPGLVCMNLVPDALLDPALGVPVHAGPSLTSPRTGFAASVVIARDAPPRDGFREVLWADGTSGWVAASALQPWSNPWAPARRCRVSYMTDGKLGFDTH